ncbi:hypothetical protein BC829DRAFT_438888 [Chytridium lagenaria]|nr:hypothetical protein BC829DRAFT_438888 [Chytridium lagenaria]
MAKIEGLEEVLNSVDEYMELQQQISAVLSQAFVHLAESKYVLGPQRLSSSSYDLRMKASTRICQENGSFSVAPEEPQEGSTSNTDKPEDAELTQRRKTKVEVVGKSDKLDIVKETDSSSTSTYSTNPIRWFGIFLPPQMQQAQAEFRQTIPLYLNLATASKKLQKYSSKIKE